MTPTLPPGPAAPAFSQLPTAGQAPPAREVLPRALALAETLLIEALEEETWAERRHGAGMARLVEDAPGKQFTVRLADEVFRSHDSTASADRMRRLAAVTGIPHWLAPAQRLMLRVGLWASEYFPALVMPAVEAQFLDGGAGSGRRFVRIQHVE